MQVSFETLDGLQRSLTIELPNTQLKQLFDSKVNDMLPRVRLDGFRQGKVPARVVKQKFGQDILGDAANELVRDSLFKAIEEQALQPAALPAVTIVQLALDKPFVYRADFEVIPTFELKTLAGHEIEQYSAIITDADFDKAMLQLRKQHQEWHNVDRASVNGDRVTIDFEGFIDNEPIQGGKAEKFDLELGSNSMIPGFETGVLGSKPGETRDITVNFPSDYHATELAGKAAIFNIKVHGVAAPTLPDVDDALASKYGIKDGSTAFVKAIKDNLNKQLEEKLKVKNNQSIFTKLAENNDIPIPSSMVAEEIKHMKQRAFGQHEQFKNKLDQLPDEIFSEQAQKGVKLSLLVAEVVKSAKLTADPDRVKAMVENLAEQYDDAAAFIKHIYGDKERLAMIENIVLEQAVCEHLLSNASVKTTPINFDELMAEPKE